MPIRDWIGSAHGVITGAATFFTEIPARVQEWRARGALMAMRADIYEDLGNAFKNAGASTSGWTLLGQLDEWSSRAASRGEPIAYIYALWTERYGATGLFSEAIADTVPPMEVVALTTAERAGELSRGLLDLSVDVRRLNSLEKHVRGLLRELGVPGIAIIGVVLFFSVSFVPQMAEFVALETMPSSTRAFYWFGRWIPFWWPLPLAIGVAAYMGGNWSMGNWTGVWRDRIDRFPLSPYPFYRDYTAARLLVALNRRLRQGDTVALALSQIGDQSTPYLKVHCDRAVANLEAARPMSDVLDTGLFNRRLMDRIGDYIKQGNFTSAVGNLAGQSFVKIEEDILANMEWVRVAAQVFMYVVIGSFIILVLSTIIESSNGIRF